MHTVMGIDPGKRGAVVCLSVKEAAVLMAVPLPEDMKAFARLLDEAIGWGYAGGLQVMIEQAACIRIAAQGERGRSGTSMFNYGQGFGRLEGVLSTRNVPVGYVRPQIWSKALTGHFRPLSEDPKVRALMAVQALFPGLGLIQPRCRTPHSGIVDALLIAEWGRRNLHAASA